MSLLEVSHLSKSYAGKTAVDDLSFSVEKGEIFGLLGPNGAGKSTAMMMVVGLRRPDLGEITISGQAVDGDLDRHHLLGLVPQELAIYPDLTGRENLTFFGKIYGLRGTALRDRVDEVLKQIGLCEHADQLVRTFSGGMKRRLNFGAGLVHEPQLMILDEPTVGVDPQSRAHLLELVQHLAAEGVGVIYASHYMEEAEAICHRVGIIDNGRLLKDGRPADLVDSAHSAVRLRVHLSASAADAEALRRVADVEDAENDELQIVVHNENAVNTVNRLKDVFERLSDGGAELVAIDSQEHNLEQVFLELTGRRLRE